MTETLVDKQLTRERLQFESGIERYRKHRHEKDETDMKPGQELLRRAVEPLTLAIEEMVAYVEAGKAGRGQPALAVSYLQHLQAEPVAYITARAIINAAAQMERMTKTAMKIAALIEEHYQFDELRSATPGLANSLERKAKTHSASSHRRFIMRIGVKATGVRGLEWKQGDKLQLGMKLIELFIEKTGLAEQELICEGRNNTQYQLRPTPATTEWLAAAHERFEFLDPRFMPMVCPPKPWTSPVDGGYLTRENRTDLIGGVSAEMRDDVFSVDMSNVYDAVNAVQATAWRINRPVFEVLRELWNAGEPVAGLPETDDVPVPARPSDIPKDIPIDDMNEEMRARFATYRKAATEAHAYNGSLISKRIAVASKVNMASDVKDEEAIWFPNNLDFRGRMYSLVPGISPQADDLGKGLIMFAEGKPLGMSGAYWMHVHIANLFGVDKVSFDERTQWVNEHREQLLDSAINPLDGARFWTEADDPWCALAACFEYAGYMIEGDDYVSHLPIAMDGSCSGLQHFSAMLRDAEGGRAVNLTPTPQPADVYTEVLTKVEFYLNSPDLATDQLAQSWRGKVLRKIVKRPCMTFAYSVTSRGMRDQILDELKKQADGGHYLPGYDNFEASSYLAPLVERAIKDTVNRAAEAMDWLRDSVKALVTKELPVNWFTPDGFPVQHKYTKTNGKRFNVWFQGIRLKIQLRVDTKKPDLRKQQSGIAPNYIHSMDACHLRMVANRMVDEGITTSFAMIHDSFGVHACDVDELHFAIRDEFIGLYSEDRLEEFRQQMLGYLPEDSHGDVSTPPHAGSLDLEEVRKADFFFS